MAERVNGVRLRAKFLSYSMLVLVGTIAVTTCLTLAFGHFYAQIYRVPVVASASTDIIVAEGQRVLYTSKRISEIMANEIMMSVKMNQMTVSYDGTQYSLAKEELTSANEGSYSIIKVSPMADAGAYYRNVAIFALTVFLVSFLLGSIIAQRYYTKTIINPVVRLRKETEKLSAGELDTAVMEEGEGEVGELCHAVELLRLKLKESVYRQKKYDDNRSFLVSSISHDLKTPVTAIRGYIEGILDGVADTPEKQEKYLNRALSKTQTLHAMIEDLLLYSKLDLNQLPFDLERVDIADYLGDCVADSLFAFEQEEKGLTLINSLKQRVEIITDPVRFRRVLQNILDNAKRHVERKTGMVEVRLRETTASVIVEIHDNGPGIAPEDLPRVFDRFYRADTARRAEGSSGLGLAIAKQIVEGLDGRIWAVSEPGEGASFMISLKKAKSVGKSRKRTM